jgi:hypothetical protein
MPNLHEAFGAEEMNFFPGSPNPQDPYKWAAGLSRGIIKLVSVQMHYIDVRKLLSVGKFDHVIIVDRDNLVDCCVSHCYAGITKQFHYNDSPDAQPFECPEIFVTKWLRHYRKYLEGRKMAIASRVPHSILNYEKFLANEVQYVLDRPIKKSLLATKKHYTVESNFPYDLLCVNYQQVKEQIEKSISC